MILVSTKFPEDIPWFKASRRALVAVMSDAGRLSKPFVIGRIYTMQATRLLRVKRKHKPRGEPSRAVAAWLRTETLWWNSNEYR